MANRRTATGPTQKTREGELNEMNAFMRSQGWYQDWFKNQGLDPNRVKLNERQQAMLTQLAEQNGLSLGDRMKFDSAGNMNQKGGFAGMPTWAKTAISAAPIAGSMLIPGAREAILPHLGKVFGMGGGGVPNAVPGVSGSLAPTLPATPGAVGGKMGGGGILKGLGKFFMGGEGRKGLDPTTLLLGGLSMFGGGEDDAPIKSMAGTSADPVRRMTEALDAIKSLTGGIQQRGPMRLRSNYAPPPPVAVNIPGIPFQIGGGLGTDPAEGPPMMPEKFPDLFGGPGGAQPRSFADLFNNRNKQNG